MTNIWLHFSLGRADRMARWILLETLVTAVSVAFGLRFGAPGVAWGYCLAMFLLCITGLMYAGRPVGLGWGELIAPLWRPAAAGAAAAWLCWSVILRAPFVQANVVRLLLFCVSFCLVYACFVLMLGGGLKTLRVIARAHNNITEPADGINAILTSLLGSRAAQADSADRTDRPLLRSVPSNETPHVRERHIFVGHIISELMEQPYANSMARFAFPDQEAVIRRIFANACLLSCLLR
jgi:hypothetical protein